MTASHPQGRISYVLLCASPFLAIAVAAPRPFRIPVVHQVVGVLLFAAIAFAVWNLAWKTDVRDSRKAGAASIAGSLLATPFALVSLLWVGIGPPFLAGPAENQMRYVVLIVASAAVAFGLIMLREVLSSAGERVLSTVGFAAIVLAAPLYILGESIPLAFYAAVVRTGKAPDVFLALSEFQDIVMFFGGALVYAAAASFALSMSRAGWIGKGTGRAYAIVAAIGLAALLTRGLQFPDPTAATMEWHSIPGFVAGIPAVPFIIPCLLGALALRKAGRK